MNPEHSVGPDQGCRNRLKACTVVLGGYGQGKDVVSHTLVDICDRIAAGHQVCLDLDFDFFFDREHATVDSWRQKHFDNPRFEGFLTAHDFTAFSPVVGHDEALQQWIDKPLSGAIRVHIDFHHDWYIDPQKLDSASLQHLDSLVTCGNYLAIAAKAGLISQLVWIYPDGFDDAAPPDIGPAMAQLGVACVFISYSDYCRHLLPVLRDATIVSTVAALSPDFVSGESLSFFFNSFDCDAEFRYRRPSL